MLSTPRSQKGLFKSDFEKKVDESTIYRPVSTDCLLNRLYRNHSLELLNTIQRIIPQQETAEDILHDAFLKIRDGIHLYKAERSQLLTWSKAVAKNTAVDHLRLKINRNNKLNQSIDHSEAELGLRHIYSFNIEKIGLRQLFTLLSADQSAVLELFYYQGYTHEEVSEALNLPLGTTKTRIRTSIKKLRRYFN